RPDGVLITTHPRQSDPIIVEQIAMIREQTYGGFIIHNGVLSLVKIDQHASAPVISLAKIGLALHQAVIKRKGFFTALEITQRRRAMQLRIERGRVNGYS